MVVFLFFPLFFPPPSSSTDFFGDKSRFGSGWQAMLASLQAGNPQRNRYEQSRNFVPPGRLMFLRPIKSAAKERRSNRQYKPVWITAQVILSAFCVSLYKSQYVVLFKLLAQKALRWSCSDRVDSFTIWLGAWMEWDDTWQVMQACQESAHHSYFHNRCFKLMQSIVTNGRKYMF